MNTTWPKYQASEGITTNILSCFQFSSYSSRTIPMRNPAVRHSAMNHQDSTQLPAPFREIDVLTIADSIGKPKMNAEFSMLSVFLQNARSTTGTQVSTMRNRYACISDSSHGRVGPPRSQTTTNDTIARIAICGRNARFTASMNRPFQRTLPCGRRTKTGLYYITFLTFCLFLY